MLLSTFSLKIRADLTVSLCGRENSETDNQGALTSKRQK